MVNESSKIRVYNRRHSLSIEMDIDAYLESVKQNWPNLQEAEKERFCTIMNERLHSRENVTVFLDVLKCYFASDGMIRAIEFKCQSSESNSFRFSILCSVVSWNRMCHSPLSEVAYLCVQ